MSTIEDLGTDARSADGYVVLYSMAVPKMTVVLSVPATPPRTTALRKLRRVIEAHPRLSVQLEGFDIDLRTIGKSRQPNVFEIKFAVRAGMEELTVPLFLEYMRQCNVITNPIVSDMRNFKIE